MTQKVLQIHVGFDLVCPWCLIGKRELERALAALAELHPGVAVEQRWHSLQLLPEIPDEGLPFREFYLQRLGSAAAVAMRQAQVREAGRRVGLTFNFDAMPVMPNTADAHALVNQVRAEQGEDAALQMIEALFEAHFHGGFNLGDLEVLDCLATAQGLQVAEELPVLPPYALPAGGVPLFVFNGRVAVAGARAAEHLLAAMEQSLLT